VKLRDRDLIRTLERSARRQRERSFDPVSTREGYDRWSAVYDATDNPLITLEERELPGLLGDLSGLDTVDIGCGTGRWTERLVTAGARVTAVDFSFGMLAKARERLAHESVHFVEHDLAVAFPFADERFDLVLSALVLEHIAELAPFFGELARVCRRGGRVALSAMHPAMLLLGCQAEFNDPQTNRDVRPRSFAHQISDFVMAAHRAGLDVELVREHEIDEQLREVSAKAAKWAGWPLLLIMIFERPA
jgi:malonyl-CoA O-methyltransferase